MDDNMTLPRLNALVDHWAEFPPVHVSLSGIVRGLAGSGKSAKPRRGSREIRPTEVMPATQQYSPSDIVSMDHTTKKGDKMQMANGLKIDMIKRVSPVSAEDLKKIEEERLWREKVN